MRTINDVKEGDIVYQNGEYAIVNDTNGNLWYALTDEATLSDNQIEFAIRVCDLDEEHYTN